MPRPSHRAALLFALVAFALLPGATRAHAQHAGALYHGAGGPFLSTALVSVEGGRRLTLTSTGGSGYSYHFDGRFRIGGGGQGSVASSRDGDWKGSVGYGGLLLAIDPLGRGIWELPLGLEVGGGRLTVERPLRADDPGRIERSSAAFFSLRAFVGPEVRLLRTAKLALHLSYQIGIHEGIALRSAGVTLQAVFLLPRPGH
ncbi:MAG TPA: hypothetical protein DFS52_30205 [Myxococcales bacterium]|nr:hypothetical protein [Myxococcales bacterium]